MKTRNGFVSNSSSTSFIITNKSDEVRSLFEFVKENPQLIEMYNDMYVYSGEHKHTQFELLKSAMDNDRMFDPNSEQECLFGVEDGTFIGRVFEYILRDGGESENFKWKFYGWHR